MPDDKTFLFQSFIISEDLLSRDCIETLIAFDHKVLGVISPLLEVKTFAIAHGIPHFYNLREAKDTLLRTRYDYLFSIINSEIIPVEIIEHATIMSINFHNALLPQYAGLHAPSWAILNNETTHGVTWHKMAELIDAGDILHQEKISIDAHETGLSLGIKCYQAAKTSFKTLVSKMHSNTLSSQKQNLSRRTYHDFFQKPINNGLINWKESAENIDRIFRALELGHYHHNRFSSTKLLINDQFYIIKHLQIQQESSPEEPGTIIDISPKGWVISTATNNLLVESVYDITSNTTSNLASIAKQHHISNNYKLSSPSPSELKNFHKTSEQFARHEMYWVKTFLSFNPTRLPFQYLKRERIKSHNLMCLSKFQLPTSSQFQSSLEIFTMICVYLWRLERKDNIQIGMVDASRSKDYNPLFFSTSKPFICKINPDDTFDTCSKAILKNIKKLSDKTSYPRDLFYRFPELYEHIVSSYPIVVCYGTDNEIQEALPRINADIILSINTTKLIIECLTPHQDIRDNPNLNHIIYNSKNHLITLYKYLSLPDGKQTSISALPMLTENEKNIILNAWSNIKSVQTITQNVITLFNEQVHQNKNKIVIEHNRQSLTYQQLNKKSNQLARYLQSLNIKHGDIIAISTDDNTIDFIVGMIACLKIACAYLPLNNNYPDQHIQYILSDAKPAIFLSAKCFITKFKHCAFSQDIPLISLEDALKSSTQEASTNLSEENITPQTMAYIIYTSGTTGAPKGVMIPHQGICRLVKNTNYIQISKDDCIAQAANISFDAATFEIWGALLNGAKLSCIPKESLLNIKQFEHHLLSENITILWLTSALFNQYADSKPEIFKNLRVLLVGGDVLNPEKIMRVMHCVNGAPENILNGYGPTENTTFSTTYNIPQNHNSQNSIPIGRAIANSSVYVLNSHLNPTPVGVPGELFTGGNGLALGYLNKPDISKEKFITAPAYIGKNIRLYKTGDMVRWLPDGTIQYIGRKDNQVKIRGFRVEIEAVHAVIMQHEHIDESAVFAIENPHKQRVLVAYIVCKNPCTESSIKDFIRRHLPQYMVPEYIVLLECMPINANGKVNRKALPPPDFNAYDIGADYIAPRCDLEKKIATIWEEIFNVKPIGIYQNFFELGGHSLLVTKLLIEMKKISDANIPLPMFLENPNIENLAAIINRNDAGNKEEPKKFWSQDIALVEKLKPAINSPPKTKSHAILLTGATGFLGAHLLHTFLEETNSDIYCLVRSANQQSAEQRILSALEAYNLPSAKNERIVPLPGDLSLPYLGLKKEKFFQLTNTIDVIYHNGASVHHVYTYDMLRTANVLSVVELMKLASSGIKKPLHFISTLSAASTFLDNNNIIYEDFIRHDTNPPEDGYSQTKWVAEIMLQHAHKNGFSINIYRPGWILGHSKTGAIAAKQNHLLLLLKGCIQLGLAPDWDNLLDIMPVDTVAHTILHTSLNDATGNVYNLVNPNTISWTSLIEFLNQRGYQVQLIDVQEWKAHLKSISPSNALYPLLPLYLKSDSSDWMKGLSKIIGANSSNTQRAVFKYQGDFPEVNNDLLNTYFNYIENKGFLNE